MSINNLIEFLKEKSNKKFFEELQKLEDISINEIQKLTTDHPTKPIKEMLSLLKLQRKNLKKIPISKELLFTDQGAQQASSWQLSQYHETKFNGFNTVADLCCGIGIDLMNIARNKLKVIAVDQDADTLKLAEFNCTTQNLQNIEFMPGKAEEFTATVDAIFIDPDRRSGSSRKISPQDYSPPFSAILELRKICRNMAIKLSPATDYRKLNLPPDSTLEFISEDGTLKEILLCMGELSTENCKRKAMLLPFNLTLQNSNLKIEVVEIQKYLFEPDPAIIRAGLVQELGSKLGYNLIDRKLALLTGSRYLPSDFGKLYEVEEIMKLDLKKLHKYVRKNEIGELIIKTRGFSESVENFRNKLKLKGKNSIVMFILRRGDDHIIVLSNVVK